MQEAGFHAAGIAATYELIPTPAEALAATVAELRAAGYAGWNVTVPHKTGMIALVDHIDPIAQAFGSVNTVVNINGVLHAYSTDGYGLEMSVRRSFGLSLEGLRVLFWGTGGAVRATAGWFATRGAAGITLVNRTVSRAEELAAIIERVAPQCQVQVLAMDDIETIRDHLTGAGVVIQATSIGLHETDPIAIPESLLLPRLRIIDMLYRPNKLLAVAPRLGCHIVNGRDMLLYQGIRSFQLWTGCEAPPLDEMGKALDAALAANAPG